MILQFLCVEKSYWSFMLRYDSVHCSFTSEIECKLTCSATIICAIKYILIIIFFIPNVMDFYFLRKCCIYKWFFSGSRHSSQSSSVSTKAYRNTSQSLPRTSLSGGTPSSSSTIPRSSSASGRQSSKFQCYYIQLT